MIHQYRKRHLYIWSILAFVLPVTFLLAWTAIPDHHSIAPGAIDNTGHPLSAVEIKETFSGSDLFLEFTIDKPIDAPGCLFLLSSSVAGSPESSLILGRLEGLGDYRFRLTESVKNKGQYLLLYDPFGKKVITHFQL